MRENVLLRADVKPGDRRVATFDHVAVATGAALIQLAFFDPRDVVDGLYMPGLRVGFGWGGRFCYCAHVIPPLIANRSGEPDRLSTGQVVVTHADRGSNAVAGGVRTAFCYERVDETGEGNTLS